MTFHSACGRILRREAQRLGYRSNFTIYDYGRPDPARRSSCLEELERDPKRFTPRGIHSQISNAKNPLDRPGGVRRARRELLRPDRRRGLRPVPEAALRLERRRLRRHALPHRRRARALPRGAREVAEGVPLRPRRRVPGHEPRAVPPPPAARRASTATSSPSAIRTSRSTASAAPTSATCSSSSATSPARTRSRSSRTTARRSTSSTPRTASSRTTASARRRTSGPSSATAIRSASSRSRTSTPRRATSPPRSRGSSRRATRAARSRSSTARTRRAACSRTSSCARAIAYQVIGGPRFYERAEIKDLVAYLQVLDNPYDAVSLLRIANRPRRGIGDSTLARLQTWADQREISLWEATAEAEIAGVGAAPQKALKAFRAHDRVAHVGGAGARGAGADRGGARSAAATSESLEAERTIEAQGRIENLQELVSRRARVARADRRRHDALVASSRRSRSTPTRTRSAATARSSRS